jgi:hypothetical protein
MSVTVCGIVSYELRHMRLWINLRLEDLGPRADLLTAGVGEAEWWRPGEGYAKHSGLVTCLSASSSHLEATHLLASCPVRPESLPKARDVLVFPDPRYPACTAPHQRRPVSGSRAYLIVLQCNRSHREHTLLLGIARESRSRRGDFMPFA